jgi:4-alpha-glucanotransferase
LKIVFSVPYTTTYEESLLIVGSIPQLGNWDAAQGLQMESHSGGVWTATIRLSESEYGPFVYRYALRDGGTDVLHYEGNRIRRLEPLIFRQMAVVEQRDFWQPPADPETNLATAPFRRVIFRRPEYTVQHCPDCGSPGIHVRLNIPAPRVPQGMSLYCSGSIPALGLWNPQKALPLKGKNFPEWQTDFHVRPVEIPFQYKYFIANEDRTNISWESGDNRRLIDYASFTHGEHLAIVVSDYAFRSGLEPWKGAGLAIPVFSLRSEKGLGVGEFNDLKPLADWAKEMGMKMIQLLPVNDTCIRMDWTDAYPYAALSVFALHPIYLNLQSIPGISDSILHKIETAAKRLNRKTTVDYEAVMSAKSDLLKLIFSEQFEAFLASAAFQDFFQENSVWLRPYAAFCYLRNRHGTSDYGKWGKFSRASSSLIEEVTEPDIPHFRDIALHYFTQYHLHHQLCEAARHAHDRGVVLKGDIPIGVDKASVETWLHPEFFHMDKSAGAPPDDFAVEGQNWGFPTYNWEIMAADGYGWWKQRLTHLSRYFDMIRLDHIIGFFRIWEIPGNAVTALRGRFNPANPISRDDLLKAGIEDIETLCKPHITTEVLSRVFGAQAGNVAREYLHPCGKDRYEFRRQFDTQQKIEAHFFASRTNGSSITKKDRTLLHGLFRLYDDIVLIPDKQNETEYFHPRIAKDLTFGFQSLPPQTQAALQDICRNYHGRRQEALWSSGGIQKLAALKAATDMMICGEDLGMVPNCTPGVMEDLAILCLRIERMPLDPGRIFADPKDYPYLSVAMPSNHDMATIRGWWEEADRAAVQFYFSRFLGHEGLAPKSCEPWICREIVSRHLYGNSMWAVFPIQDILGMDANLRRPDPHQERINEPSTTRYQWNFRLHITLENLLSRESFNADVRQMVRSANR